jgi:hypothetical protein
MRSTLCPTVNEGLQTVWVIFIHHSNKRGVDPPSCFNGIKTTDDDLKLHVVLFILVLNLAMVSARIEDKNRLN